MKRLELVLGLMLLPAVALATNYNLKSGVTDWSSLDSYTVGGAAATTLPGASDVIVLPTETFTLDAADPKFTASISQINAVMQVSIPKGARLIIDVGESDVTITCAEMSSYTSNGERLWTDNGTIEKRGTGTLRFNVTGNTHIANLQIVAGTVYAEATKSLYFGAAEIAAGATFYPGKAAGAYPVFRGPLTGAGTVSSVDGATKTTYLCLYGEASEEEAFSGTISGMVAIQVRPGSVQNITSIANTFTDGVTIGGRLNIGKIGKQADSGSSIGTKNPVYLGYVDSLSAGGELFCLGTGVEETDRSFSFQYSPTANVINGGEGNLVLANEWKGDLRKTTYPSQQRVTLAGAGDNIMRGKINDIVTDNGTYSFYVTKKGTGTWTIEENANSKMAGVWAAEEGTLRYASLREAGINCALGFSTNLYGDVWGAENMTEANRVGYAFLLGGTNAAAPGTLEYAGANYVLDTTRKIAVTGTGCLSTTNGPVAFADVVSAKAGEAATLILDGPAGVTNDLAGVTDGEGTLGLIKSGAGVWRLAGDNDFSGPVAVTGGTLVVATPDTSKYSYYRLTIKETYGVKNNVTSSKTAYNRQCCFVEFSLYGSDRMPINADLADAGTPVALTGGSFCLLDAAQISNSTNAYKLFDYSTPYPVLDYSDSRGAPDHTKPETWMTFVLRLPESAPSASYFDLAGTFASTDSRRGDIMNPVMWKIEASCDGYTWEEVNATDDATSYVAALSGNLRYYSNDGLVSKRGKTVQVESFPDDFTLSRTVPAKTDLKPFGKAKSVRVDKGATLVKEGPGAVEVNELVIDKSAGLGTLAGFTLAAQSTLSVTGVEPEAEEVDLPGTLAVTGLDQTSWTIKVNGAVSTKYSAEVTSSGVKLVKRGLTLYLR